MCFPPCELSPRLFSYIDMNDLEHGKADHVLRSNKGFYQKFRMRLCMAMIANLYSQYSIQWIGNF